MAKKKGKSKKPAASGSSSPSSSREGAKGKAQKAASDPWADAMEQAVFRGSYAGVRHLAAELPADLEGAKREAALEPLHRVTIDPAQLAVAGVALVAVIITALLTLTSG